MNKQLEQEMLSALDGLCKGQRAVPEAEWFVQLVCRRFSPAEMQSIRPRLIVLGEDLPWELTHAFGYTPYYLPGGSLVTTHASEQLLPRDADPVSRSQLGYLLSDSLGLASQALVVTALTGDNRRKLVGLLREQGIAVAAVDLPPVGDDAAAKAAWGEALCRLAEEMEEHLHRSVRKAAMARAADQYRRLRRGLLAFRQAADSAPGALSGPLVKLVTECVWYAPDSEEYLRRLNRLTRALSRRAGALPQRRPRVLLAGSPVLFPNEKLPLLMASAGLEPGEWADPVSLRFRRPEVQPFALEPPRSMLRRLAALDLPWSLSGGQCVNRPYLAAVEESLQQGRVEGIVCHVLKGQIEWDFELERVETIARQYSVPVFRIETDYQPQDVEQLRIRVEAFAEMLREMRFSGEGLAQ